MDNITALLQRHQSELASRNTLFLDACDPALAQLAAGLTLHTDNFGFKQQNPDANLAAWPTYGGEDLVVIPLPKSHERLLFLLDSIAAQLDKPIECWLIGPAKGGIKGALKHLESRCAAAPLQKDSARHCKLYAGLLQPADNKPGWRYFNVDERRVASLPGVFSHGRLDAGSELLLDDLRAHPLSGRRVLDVGCGAGVLTLHLAASGHLTQAVDISATAVAACQQSLADNQLAAEVYNADLLDGVDGRFDAIVSNPPFHNGMTRDLTLAKRLIENSRKQLTSRGELRLVANRNLPYHDWLKAAFEQVEISRETSRFRIWRAHKPR